MRKLIFKPMKAVGYSLALVVILYLLNIGMGLAFNLMPLIILVVVLGILTKIMAGKFKLPRFKNPLKNFPIKATVHCDLAKVIQIIGFIILAYFVIRKVTLKGIIIVGLLGIAMIYFHKKEWKEREEPNGCYTTDPPEPEKQEPIRERLIERTNTFGDNLPQKIEGDEHL